MKRARLFLSPPFTGAAERRAVADAFRSGYVAPCGPQVDAFERRLEALSGRRRAVALSSGTAALDLAMEELGVDGSWTVIAPTLTFVATVSSAFRRGARLVFVDCAPDATLDAARLEEALADAPRASRRLVLGVDLFGRCCDYAAIERLCRAYGAVFVCDSAEAVGATDARGRPAGSAGRMAVYSFNGNKIVTTSGGGALLTDDPGIAERALKRSRQCRENRPWYEHRAVGFNYRLSNLLAAVGLAQLDRLPDILARRRRTAARYAAALPDWTFLPSAPGENHWLTVVFAPTRAGRDAALARLEAAGAEGRPVWKPMHLQPVFKGCRAYGGARARDYFERGLCLPSGSGMTAADVRRVVRALAGKEGL